MHNSPRKIVAGNWKMHGSLQMLTDYVQRFSAQQSSTKVTTLLFPPVAYLAPLAAELGKAAGTLQIEHTWLRLPLSSAKRPGHCR
jgi:triosephosphate isomerase